MHKAFRLDTTGDHNSRLDDQYEQVAVQRTSVTGEPAGRSPVNARETRNGSLFVIFHPYKFTAQKIRDFIVACLLCDICSSKARFIFNSN